MHHGRVPTQVTERDFMDEDAFRWAYAIMREDGPELIPLQYFDRVQTAKEELEKLREAYPEIPFGIYIQGDQLYVPQSSHENVH
jgi:hypothetical protein